MAGLFSRLCWVTVSLVTASFFIHAQPPVALTSDGEGVRLEWQSAPLHTTFEDSSEPRLHPDYRVLVSDDLQMWSDAGAYVEGGIFTDVRTLSQVLSRTASHRFYRLVSVVDVVDDDLSALDLSGADLRDWDLRLADLSGAILTNADLRGADLRGVDFRGADLTGANLEGAKTKGANFQAVTGYEAPPNSNIDPEDDPFLGVGPEFGGGGLFGGAAFDGFAPNANLGFTVGGAQDINNFRGNIENDFLPLVSAITYEGLFSHYFFDRGQAEPCEELFCPSYSYAISADPISQKKEYYLSVGLNSGIKESDFERNDLNVVVVIDVSGSMGSPFDQYYYDGAGNQVELTEEERTKIKMQVANESVVSLLDHLRPADRLGIVLFSRQARVFQDLTFVEDLNLEELSQQILAITDGGGTNMGAGYELATRLYTELGQVDASEEENRIIFLTDAQPNRGDISEGGLLGLTKNNADKGIFTSFIGIGLDFNTDLIEAITDVRGSNYFSVHSPSQFEQRLATEFEFMVTPLVFGLELTMESQDFAIDKVYGSPQADESTGRLLKVDTLFPSATSGGKTKGGIVLLKLRKKNPEIDTATLNLKVRYEDREEQVFESTETVTLADGEAGRYDNTGIRKGILLARYGNLLRDWVFDERLSYERQQPVEPSVDEDQGIVLPPIDWKTRLGPWERQSTPLFVSRSYRQLFSDFREHLQEEAAVLEDETLDQEDAILDKLSNFGRVTFWEEDDDDVDGQ